MSESTNIRVAVRIRPLLSKEKLERCSECVRPLSESELVMMGKEKQFTFDQVFGQTSHQHEIYAKNVSPLVRTLFDGYNATVLAYGQTGSGKTYTMGTSTDSLVDDDDSKLGVIPRAMSEIFDIIEEKKAANPGAEFYLRVQFLEIYGEDIRDLLDPAGSSEGKVVSVRESEKGMEVCGAVEESVKSTAAMYEALERGSLCRTTGSTEMNVHSSRSHAIFTIIIEQHLPVAADSTSAGEDNSSADPNQQKKENAATKSGESTEGEAAASNGESAAGDDVEYRIAKFHFVDLAGSERAKRTGATGTRLKEGININKGLLALGNVISALGDETKPKGTHVPYRDSKLTRMLQDSLGGNSRTLMIACVSPADANFEETLNALRYANRARNIKNKPIVNRDPNSSQIATLKAQIQQLKLQLYGNGGPQQQPQDQHSMQNFQQQQQQGFGAGMGFGAFGNGEELSHARQELEMARMRADGADAQVLKLTDALEREKRSRSEVQEKYIMAAAQVDFYKSKFGGETGEAKDIELDEEAIKSNAQYLRKIEELQRQLETSDGQLSQARKELKSLQSEFTFADSLDEVEKEIVRNARIRRSLEGFHGAGKGGAAVAGSGLDETTDMDDDEDDDDLDDDEDGHADDFDPHALSAEDLAADPSLLEVNEDDDEATRELKEKFQKTQDSYRSMVQSYDVTLRSKQMIMKKVVEERKKFEAMKAHYEAKMAEMNAEVLVTQQQRDALDCKIKELETKKSSEANKTQITKLRLQLKDKMERLKNLEKQGKQLADAKRMASKWQVKEQKIQREIDSMKKQKVEYQRRMEENAKKYREEAQQRKQEIARLRKQQRVLAQDKQKLQMRSTRDERLLRQKTEQVTAMQRKLRQAQRLTSFNKQLTEKERKQRKLLDKWARERIKHDEELERLQRSLSKKQAAIERKEQLCRELEDRKRAAEQRANVAEKSVAQALNAVGSTPDPSPAAARGRSGSTSAVVAQPPQTSAATPLAASSTPTGPAEKQSLRSFFVSTKDSASSSGGPLRSRSASAAASASGSASAAKMTPEEMEAVEELEQRLEAAEYEIIFHKKQCEAAAAKIGDVGKDAGADAESAAGTPAAAGAKRDAAQAGQQRESASKLGTKDDSFANIFPVELTSLEEAKSVFQELLQMYVDAKRSKSQLKQTIERLKQQAYVDESRSRRDLQQRRKSLMPSSASASGTVSSPASSIAGTPAFTRHSMGHAGSPMAAAATPITARVLQDKLGESSELCNVLLKENQKLLGIIKENGIRVDPGLEENLNEAKLRALEDQVRQLQVSGSSSALFSARDTGRRSSLGANFASMASAMLATPQSQQAQSQMLAQTPNDAEFAAARRAAERADILHEEQTALNQQRTPGVFDRLSNTQNFTGIHKRKIIDQQTRENTLDELVIKPITELEVDSLQLTDAHPESTVDGMTLNPAALAEIQRKTNGRSTSPRASLEGTGSGSGSGSGSNRVGSPRAGRRSSNESGSNSPSFTRMTESYSNRCAQESKLRAARSRESTGSVGSASSAMSTSNPKSANAAVAGVVAPPAPALASASGMGTSGGEIKNGSGTYRAEVGGLYRNNATSGTGSRSNGRARQLAWESQKAKPGSADASAKPGSGNTRSGSPGTPEDNPEKENTSDDAVIAGGAILASAKPIHERLADPKYYTGVQKQKALGSDAGPGGVLSSPGASTAVGQAFTASSAQASAQANATAAQLRKRLAQERARRKKVTN
ncbi:Kinesin-like protein KIN-4A [Hondaea fermentalgiana]|uniref:Kinesin-like protein KIN-4A n=1 Tax=Hondaea fermentalgiana TaxID=2315210 RepID=A0A2R5GNU9_9STRA|nr:Kinesin-like protein KIN-4A [Hondaea fermentalgiana]|eukprot:GBG31418.1 Kinesin-like protein KIN-4A [Hondaea fermentalgiana]